MRWFACFRPEHSVESPSPQKAKARSRPHSVELQKQDSAYALPDDILRSQQPDSAAIKEPAAKQNEGDAAFERDFKAYGQLIPQDYSTTDSLNGYAASLPKYGPPKPSCNQARLDNLKELGLLNRTSGDPEIQHIMQLMCTVFNTNSALVAFLGDEKVFVHDAVNFVKGDFGWRMSLCAHTLTPANHQVMIVEDAQKDARFAHLPLITHKKVRFYAGTPIVSSRGHRLGTVCFTAQQPRKFDAEGSQMLINMGELITRELERDWIAAQQTRNSSEDGVKGLLRAVECFNDAVMFVDTSQPKWQVMHMNTAAQTKLKLYDVVASVDGEEPVLLWDLFSAVKSSDQNNTSPWQRHAAKIQEGQNFTQCAGFAQKYARSGQNMPLFNLTFRCAATTNIDSNAASVGAPAFLPVTANHHQFYFVTIAVDQTFRGSAQSLFTALTGRVTGEVPFEGVKLGPLLGKGGYGSVYRGFLTQKSNAEQIVAIKVIEGVSNLQMVDGQPLEVTITKGTLHPNIVNTLDYAVVKSQGSPTVTENGHSAGSQKSGQSKTSRDGPQVWMMLEYCDCGSLQEASEKGHFRREGQVDLARILGIALHVATGVAFLHSSGVVHGDLTGGNVLLASDPSSPLGLIAKVADFGLARNLDVASRIETRTYGTVTHMPPELLEKGIFSKATDVFAFGVLMWEMWHGVRAWSSLTFAQIITVVVAEKKSLQFSESAPADYAALARQCMHADPDARPPFTQVIATLQELHARHSTLTASQENKAND